MDFNWSPEDEAFRHEFSSWLEANVPKDQRTTTARYSCTKKAGDWQRRLAWHQKAHAADGSESVGPRNTADAAPTWFSRSSIMRKWRARMRPRWSTASASCWSARPSFIGAPRNRRSVTCRRFLSGEEIWCQGYSEPGSGSDVASLQTRAVEEGDYFIVNGQKVWTSDAHHADMCILLMRTDPEAPKHKGISYILVDMHSPGVTVRPLVQITGDANFNEVFFEDVKVPKKNLIGEKNQGWQVAITTLMFERSGIGGGRDMLGQVKELKTLAKTMSHNGSAARGTTRTYGKRFRSSRAKPGHQVHRLCQITRRLKGLPPGPEGSVLKLAASELNLKMNKFAMELLGPYSQMDFKAPFAMGQGQVVVSDAVVARTHDCRRHQRDST